MRSPAMLPLRVPAFIMLSILLGGCLTASRKATYFSLNDDGSGTGRMVFLNVMSQEDEEGNRTLADYTNLIDSWVNGDEFERANPALYDIEKRLIKQGEFLHGEVTFSFGNYQDVGLYRHNESGPYMYYSRLNTSNVEQFDTTNGTYGGETMPVIFWPEETKEFFIGNVFNTGGQTTHSLLPLYERLGTEDVEEE